MALLQNAERQRQVKAGIRKFREFIKTHPETWFALYWPFHLAFYEYWNKHTMTLNYHIIYSPLDDKYRLSSILSFRTSHGFSISQQY